MIASSHCGNSSLSAGSLDLPKSQDPSPLKLTFCGRRLNLSFLCFNHTTFFVVPTRHLSTHSHILYLVSWDKILICSLDRLRTRGPLASTYKVLGAQACAVTCGAFRILVFNLISTLSFLYAPLAVWSKHLSFLSSLVILSYPSTNEPNLKLVASFSEQHGFLFKL